MLKTMPKDGRIVILAGLLCLPCVVSADSAGSAPADSAWRSREDARFQPSLDAIILARYKQAADLRAAASAERALAESRARDSLSSEKTVSIPPVPPRVDP